MFPFLHLSFCFRFVDKFVCTLFLDFAYNWCHNSVWQPLSPSTSLHRYRKQTWLPGCKGMDGYIGRLGLTYTRYFWLIRTCCTAQETPPNTLQRPIWEKSGNVDVYNWFTFLKLTQHSWVDILQYTSSILQENFFKGVRIFDCIKNDTVNMKVKFLLVLFCFIFMVKDSTKHQGEVNDKSLEDNRHHVLLLESLKEMKLV